jgi:hypothetical protein
VPISTTGMPVPFGNVHHYSIRKVFRHRSLLRCMALLAACLGPSLVHARDSPTQGFDASSRIMAADQLSMRVKSDRLTLAVAKATQVYLSGVIDAGAPQRFDDLVKTGKIPARSDVYLDAGGTDTDAGLALGKLFRASSMVTHLGAPSLSGQRPRAAVCMDACVLAYLGGLYRWTPAGADHVGLHGSYLTGFKLPDAGKVDATNEVVAYFKALNSNATAFLRTLTPSGNDVNWLSADQMFGWELANNGRLTLQASYQRSSAPPTLTMTQTVRDGENKITLVCAPDGVTLTSRYTVGIGRAQQLMARETRSYFEINEREVLPEQSTRARLDSDAIVFSRPLSMEQLADLLSTNSMGAWIKDKGGNVRYGFTMGPAMVKASVPSYYADCEKIVQRPRPQAP